MCVPVPVHVRVRARVRVCACAFVCVCVRLEYNFLSPSLYIYLFSVAIWAGAALVGKTAGASFHNAEIFHNPFAGLVLGILGSSTWEDCR